MNFGEAFINVLAVLAVILAGGFLIFFVGNFLVSYLESKPSVEKQKKAKKVKKTKKTHKKQQEFANDLIPETNIISKKDNKKDMGTITEFVIDEPKPVESMPIEEKKDDFNITDWFQKEKTAENKNFNEIDFNKMFSEQGDPDYDFFSKTDNKKEDLSVDDESKMFQSLDNIFNENEDFNFGDNYETYHEAPENNVISGAKALPVMNTAESIKVKDNLYNDESEEHSEESEEQKITSFAGNMANENVRKNEEAYELSDELSDRFNKRDSDSITSQQTRQTLKPEILTAQNLKQDDEKFAFVSQEASTKKTLPQEVSQREALAQEINISQQNADIYQKKSETLSQETNFLSQEAKTSPKETDISPYKKVLSESYFHNVYDTEQQVEADCNLLRATQQFKAETLKESQLKAEIEQLKQELLAQKLEYEQLKKESELSMHKLQTELSELSYLYSQAEKQIEEEEKSVPLLTIEEYEHRLEVLKERLKINEKELRANKKEFIPLQRVRKNLDKDKKKLRRKEAIIAKQKVILYGVNNISEIDPEKAKKLEQEIDLLDGLRLSVKHCEEVIEANKERYPILETTYRILTSVIRDLKDDIIECEENIKQIKNETDESDGGLEKKADVQVEKAEKNGNIETKNNKDIKISKNEKDNNDKKGSDGEKNSGGGKDSNGGKNGDGGKINRDNEKSKETKPTNNIKTEIEKEKEKNKVGDKEKNKINKALSDIEIKKENSEKEDEKIFGNEAKSNLKNSNGNIVIEAKALISDKNNSSIQIDNVRDEFESKKSTSSTVN